MSKCRTLRGDFLVMVESYELSLCFSLRESFSGEAYIHFITDQEYYHRLCIVDAL